MGSHFKTISVIDGNGDQLFVYEIRRRLGLFTLRAHPRLELCTGEAVVPGGDDRTFIVLGTGETLTRVTGGSTSG